MKNKTAVLAFVAASLAISGTVYAQSDHTLERGVGTAVAGTGSSVCKYGFDTREDQLTPRTSLTTTTSRQPSVQLTKICTGPTEGRFTSEVVTDTGLVTIVMRAQCIATGGQTDPCAVGEQVFASPGGQVASTFSRSFGVLLIQTN